MLNRMMTVGNRWTKGNMDRVYVNNETMTQLLDTEASNGVEIRNHFNRRERQNLKMFYDIVKDEVVVNTGDESAKQELINALMAMVMPEEVETTEEAETTETTETPKFEEGKSYVATRTCLKYRVVKRTAKMVTLEDVEGGEIVRRKIRTDEIGDRSAYVRYVSGSLNYYVEKVANTRNCAISCISQVLCSVSTGGRR